MMEKIAKPVASHWATANFGMAWRRSQVVVSTLVSSSALAVIECTPCLAALNLQINARLYLVIVAAWPARAGAVN